MTRPGAECDRALLVSRRRTVNKNLHAVTKLSFVRDRLRVLQTLRSKP